VAEYGIKYRTRSSKDVKHIGLNSAISNQILKKYTNDKTAKKVTSVKLTIPKQKIELRRNERTIKIIPLKLKLKYHFPDNFEKINQIEVGEKYVYVSVTVPEREQIEPEDYLGVDLNTTGHIAVMSNPKTGKIWKLGKKAQHIYLKYKNERRKLQVNNRESRIVRDLNHKISSKIVETAAANNCGIRMENLKGIRDSAKCKKSFKYSLHSWSFYQLQFMLEYKARLLGVKIKYINPEYTSQNCSRCGYLGIRYGESFKCPHCGHVDHADVNAAFNIALRPGGQSGADRDVSDGSTGAPQVATV
ncbi:MAG: RNA-guided endonuclease InsQ/TnpB family protein, partial [Methanohalobium sp.]|uniref:RNA-guided endonuclease InsQ/TnpB family protein n=1 Tax=Methanohalobium sp. TaxID=2837493 RepID=UPI00397B34E1